AAPDDERPPVFLIPPIFGDEPNLADFRRSLSEHVWLQTLELPDLGCPASLLSDMVTTGHFVATEIARRLPQGDILLAGYSFGGCVAIEAAALLVAQGRQLPYDAPTLLGLSETSIASGTSHLWPRLCSNLNIVRLPGQHHEIFEPQALELLTPAFLQAVKAAGTAAR